jgi:hypothetical protein
MILVIEVVGWLPEHQVGTLTGHEPILRDQNVARSFMT